MRARRDVALAVVAWVVVVAVCASLVWAVISRAGRGVAGGDDALPAAEQSAPRSPASSPTPSRSPSRSPSASPSHTASSPSTPETTARRSWQGPAGVVSAECRGAAVRLTGAVPSSGYGVEVDDTGPDRLRVEFESGDGDRRTRVEATCRAGLPVFTAEDKGQD
ncbi:MAG: hypothetical protein ABWX84_05365 [Nocardioides sp.]